MILPDTMEAVVVEPPAGSEQHLCLDAAFFGTAAMRPPACSATSRTCGRRRGACCR
jgi:hypothetical protein